TADRKKQRHPLLWVLSIVVLVIIAVAFLGGPLLGTLRPTGRLIFGYYDGEPIEYKPDSYFSRQRDMYAEQIQQMQDSSAENVQWQAFQVWKGAYDQTVVHTAILQQAEKSGLHISEDRIDKALTRSGPYVQDGKFNPELYRNTSDSDKQTHREIFRENLIHEQWMDDYSSILRPSHQEDFFRNMASPERKFQYIYYDINDYPASEVENFARQHSELFRTIRVSRISLKTDETEANEILSQLEESPERFEELARNHSTDSYADSGGDMGWKRYNDIVGSLEDEEAAETVFSLEEGETTGLLKTSSGWSIYRCDEEAREADLSDEDTVSEIRSYIIDNERGTVEDYFLQQAATVAEDASETGFAEAVRGNDKEYWETGFFPINYGGTQLFKTIEENDEEGVLQGASQNERVLKKLFSAPEGGTTEPFVLGSSIVAAHVVEEREAPEDAENRVGNYYNQILSRFLQNEARNLFLNSDKLEDNFMEVFSRNFMNS
ncbi:MAG: peptidylprolyl isomerase, partial [Spirochaetaceae bacterium]